jgi:hypothetical protein
MHVDDHDQPDPVCITVYLPSWASTLQEHRVLEAFEDAGLAAAIGRGISLDKTEIHINGPFDPQGVVADAIYRLTNALVKTAMTRID